MLGSPPRAVLTGLVLVAIALAGCLGGSGQAPVDDVADNETDNVTPDNVDNYTNNSTVDVDEDTKFDPDSDLHAHDYWDGRVEKTLIDEKTVQVDWAQWTADCAQTASCQNVPRFVVDVPISEDSDDPNFVYPGTGSLNVTLEWKSEGLEDTVSNLNPKMCVSNRGYVPNCRTSDLSTNATHVYSESGETWEIADDGVVNPRTADPPHALKSNWRFLIQPCDSRISTGFCFPQGIPNVGISSFTVTVSIHKAPGDLPVDPPHFAFYDEGETELAILDGYEVSDGAAKSTHQQWMSRQTQDEDRVMWYVGSSQIAHAKTTGQSEQPVVPGETKELAVELQWSSDTDADLELRYRTAADNWKADWTTPSSSSGCGSGCVGYTIPVTSEEADSPYALQTQWEFGVFHVSEEPTPMTNYDVQLSVLAQREVL